MSGLWNPGLTYLLRKRATARVRQLFRGVRTVKGAIATLAGLTLFGMWLSSFLLAGTFGERKNPAEIRSIVPFATLIFTLMNSILTRTDTGIVFSRFEIAWMFTGPFSRRQLLVYRILGNLISVIPVALLMALMLRRYSVTWWGGFFAVWNGFWLLQSVQMVLALLTASFERSTLGRWRRLLIALSLIAGAWLLGGMFSSQGSQDLASAARLTQSTTAGWILLLPFQAFGQLMAASGSPQLLLWLIILVAENVLLCLLIIRFDANFLESSVAASERLEQKIARFQRGGLANMRSSDSYRSRRFPYRWLVGGAGAIVWRQALAAIRSSRSFVTMLGIASIALIIPLVVTRDGVQPDLQTLIFLASFSVIFMPQMLRLDFRSELDRMDVIKLLPISPIKLVLSELAIPVVLTTLLQWTVLAILCGVRQVISWEVGLFVAFSIPLNLLVFGVENLMFLIYPYRLPAAGIADLQAFVRHSLITGLKLMLVGILAGVSLGVGAAVYWLGSQSATGFAIASWCVVVAFGAGLMPFLCLALRRFDPSHIQSD